MWIMVRKFEIYAGDTLIGTTSFELGDPPMGVACGEMTPTPAYSIEYSKAPDTLNARLASVPIPSVGGMYIEDYSEDLGEIAVTILGIAHELYEELFPEHVEAYEEQFKS
nr:hypothetical protein [uncultured Shinella sp.]